MLVSPAILVLLVVLLAACGAAVVHRRRSRTPWRRLHDLTPVSGQWLAEYRRGGESARQSIS